MRGGPEFFCVSQGGGAKIFLHMPREGNQNFFAHAKEGTRKNDSSLIKDKVPKMKCSNIYRELIIIQTILQPIKWLENPQLNKINCHVLP